MKRKIIVFLLALCTLCVPVFAFSKAHKWQTCEDDIYYIKYDNYVHTYINNDSVKECAYEKEDPNIYFELRAKADWIDDRHTTYDGCKFYLINMRKHTFVTNNKESYKFLKSKDCTVSFDGDNIPSFDPPQLAPIVGADLKTEYVLSAILPLVPIILAFLVAYVAFCKGYGILLKVLGKA